MERRRSVAEEAAAYLRSCARVRAVLVDDEPDIRFLWRTLLEYDGGFEVVGEASTGRAAVAVAAEVHPDVVVLDLAMPEMDGLAALPQILADSPDTKVLVCTAYDQRGAAAAALGADAVLIKDKPERLIDALRGVLDR